MANDQGPKVFLSYAHADKAHAKRVAMALEESDCTVWWDALIEAGSRFASSIDEALETADAVVVLWSKHSIDSDWVRDEASHGRDRHRLVPLSLDATLPPLGFRQYQTIDMSAWRGGRDTPEMDGVCRAIETVVGKRPVLRRLREEPITRRRAIVVGGGVAAAAAVGGAVAWQQGVFRSPRTFARSIAVLPFKNLSGDPSQAFLSEALTEEVRAALVRNSGLLVLAAASSNAVADAAEDARTIARQLNVAYLLDGSVQRAGDRVRVATNLTNGKTGFSEWSQRVEFRMGDIFAIQSEIARRVSTALSVQVATDAPVPGGTRNAEAYMAYLRGKSLYNLAKDEETDREARANFEVAIAADPKFALAHAALSRVLASLAASNAEASELKSLYEQAVTEAEKAVELAPDLADGQLALGYAKFAGFLDVRGAKPSYDKAYELGQGNGDILLLYALYIVRLRQFEDAKTAIDRALVLDPLNPRTHRAAGIIAYASRDYDTAIEKSRRAIELNPEISVANYTIGNSLTLQGKLAEAREAYAAEKTEMFRLTGLAIVEQRAGNSVAAGRAFDELVKAVGDAALYQQAEVMAQRGKADDAIRLLQRARAVHDSGLTAIATDPMLDPIARDPRFASFVREIGFA